MEITELGLAIDDSTVQNAPRDAQYACVFLYKKQKIAIALPDFKLKH